MGLTLEDRLKQSGRHPSGFDYLRIALASAVIVWHCFGVPYGMAWATDPLTVNPAFWVLVRFLLPAFFTLSGFLVASSLERAPSLVVFLELRALRIIPALAVEIVLSALILGPWLTKLPLASYFTDPTFFAYFWNVVGYMHFQLPGVFLDNPIPRIVNGQLWTVPWELDCYVALSILALFGVVKRGAALIACSALGVPALILYEYFSSQNGLSVHNDLGVPGRVLVVSFLFGVALYRFRTRVPHSAALFALALVAYVALNFAPFGRTLITIPAAYLTVYVGVQNWPKAQVLQTGDYSYGIYIYGFAIQQAIVAMGPPFRHWYVVLPLAALIAPCFAAFSWFAVEKPALQLRRRLPAVNAVVARGLGVVAWPRLGDAILRRAGYGRAGD